MWIVLGIIAVVVVLVGLVLWWLLSGPDDELDGDDRDGDGDFAVHRKWGWEFALTEEQEKALMEGLRAYHKSKDGPVHVDGQGGQLMLFAPQTVISLYLLATRFVALGPDAVSYPVSAVGRLVDEFADKEQPGVLHLRDDWFPAEGVDGMDRTAFADLVMDVLMNDRDQRVSLGSWNGDGLVEAVVDAAGLGNNNLVLDLGRVLDQYVPARQAQPQRSRSTCCASSCPDGGRRDPRRAVDPPATDEERRILAGA